MYRAKLSAITVDKEFLQDKSVLIAAPSSNPESRVLEILSEPVTVNSTYSNLADELGDTVAKYAFNLKVDDTSSPVVFVSLN
jgi:hypothetical protein